MPSWEYPDKPMPVHAEKRILPFSARQLFDLVADVEKYPEFLPWCVGARLLHQEGNVLRWKLMIGFKIFRESFTSEVTLMPPDDGAVETEGEALPPGAGRIDVFYVDGPLRHLRNRWVFAPAEGGAEIDFHVDFEFHSRLLERLIGTLFNEAVRHMVTAFETRAKAIYGPCDGGASSPKFAS